MPSAFQLENVSCHYGSFTAVDGVSVSIESGERVAFIGPSGSGKTTLLRVMNTMRSQEEGTLSIFGQDPGNFSGGELQSFRSSIATIPQHLGLIPNLTAIQNVILGRGGKRGTLRSVKDLLFPSTADKLAIHELLERVGIAEKLFSPVARLSGGQQQRVAIARALFQKPKALLADEPVSSVDPARARDTVKLFKELSDELGFTLCVSLHDVALAKEFFPRLVGLRAGKIVFDGAPSELSDSELSALYDLSDEEMMKDA